MTITEGNESTPLSPLDHDAIAKARKEISDGKQGMRKHELQWGAGAMNPTIAAIREEFAASGTELSWADWLERKLAETMDRQQIIHRAMIDYQWKNLSLAETHDLIVSACKPQ